MNPAELLKNPEELKKLSKKVFDSYDINKNGSVDKEELKKALTNFYSSQGGPVPDDSIIDVTFKALDLDKNNSLSLEEFELYVKKMLTK